MSNKLEKGRIKTCYFRKKSLCEKNGSFLLKYIKIKATSLPYLL